MKILIIEDDQNTANNLKEGLEHSMLVIDVAYDGTHGSFLARTNAYDLVILDFLLPNKTGDQVLEEIRQDGKTMPILMLSVKFDSTLKASLLNKGADDYVQKPYSCQELVARIHALLRRSKKILSPLIKIGMLEINLNNHELKFHKNKIKLTRKEFLLIKYLAINKDRVVNRGELIEHVWDINADIFSNTIEATMLRLRKKLRRFSQNQVIETVNGVGYKMVVL